MDRFQPPAGQTMTPHQAEEVRALLCAWTHAEANVISERSFNMYADMAALYRQAQERAEILEIEWNDQLFPEWWIDQAKWAEEVA